MKTCADLYRLLAPKTLAKFRSVLDNTDEEVIINLLQMLEILKPQFHQIEESVDLDIVDNKEMKNFPSKLFLKEVVKEFSVPSLLATTCLRIKNPRYSNEAEIFNRILLELPLELQERIKYYTQ